MHPALNMTGPSPVCCHFLFPVPWDGIAAGDVGVEMLLLEVPSPRCGVSTKHISGHCFSLVLLSPPIAGDGGRANTAQSLALGCSGDGGQGQTVSESPL